MIVRGSSTRPHLMVFHCVRRLADSMGIQGIGKMKGIVWENGWRWIFILVSDIPFVKRMHLTSNISPQEGLVTIVVAVAAYWFIENYPETAKFLSKPEKDFIQARLAADSDATHHEEFTWNAVYDAFRDPSCWLYGLGFHTMSLPLYTLSLFLVCCNLFHHF